MEVTRMSAPLGAVVEGVDVRSLDDGVFEEINQLLTG